MYKRESLVFLCAFLMYILFVTTGNCSCSTQTTEKCATPVNGRTYHVSRYHTSGPSEYCGYLDEQLDDTVVFGTNDSSHIDGDCRIDPDKISGDRCTVTSNAMCENGAKMRTVITYHDKDYFSGSLTISFSDFSCVYDIDVYSL